jgi:hypothetical protein
MACSLQQAIPTVSYSTNRTLDHEIVTGRHKLHPCPNPTSPLLSCPRYSSVCVRLTPSHSIDPTPHVRRVAARPTRPHAGSTTVPYQLLPMARETPLPDQPRLGFGSLSRHWIGFLDSFCSSASRCNRVGAVNALGLGARGHVRTWKA